MFCQYNHQQNYAVRKNHKISDINVIEVLTLTLFIMKLFKKTGRSLILINFISLTDKLVFIKLK